MKFENFDKKEFQFNNKMLMMKKIEDLTKLTENINAFPNHIAMHKVVEN